LKFAAVSPGVVDSTFAPFRFVPLINTRTGLIVLSAHQLGGSIFCTDGA
jgi:hypothetical protein